MNPNPDSTHGSPDASSARQALPTPWRSGRIVHIRALPCSPVRFLISHIRHAMRLRKNRNAVTNTATASQPQSDIEKIKARQKATWEDGDYADFATYMHAGAVDILQNWDLGSAQSILDVG